MKFLTIGEIMGTSFFKTSGMALDYIYLQTLTKEKPALPWVVRYFRPVSHTRT